MPKARLLVPPRVPRSSTVNIGSATARGVATLREVRRARPSPTALRRAFRVLGRFGPPLDWNLHIRFSVV
jgi:hypothetical protein